MEIMVKILFLAQLQPLGVAVVAVEVSDKPVRTVLPVVEDVMPVELAGRELWDKDMTVVLVPQQYTDIVQEEVVEREDQVEMELLLPRRLLVGPVVLELLHQ